VTELLPDVALLDLLMPTMDGVTAAREIRRLAPRTQIIILTSYYDDEHIFNAIAQELVISEPTVRTQAANILCKEAGRIASLFALSNYFSSVLLLLLSPSYEIRIFFPS
jgi:DNA-binding NarL/FixJ family response regulator